MDPLRVAVVGVGHLGKEHARIYAAMKDADLVGVVDTDRAQARRVARRCRTKAFTSVASVLDQVDAVSVVVPTVSHLEVARPFLGDRTDKHIGFIWTIFFFILTMNLLGLVPIGKAITLMTGKVNHLEGAATANIWIVGALAMVAFLAIHVSGMREQGMWNYFKNFAPKVPKPMIPFIYFMEIIGAIVKPFSLAIRLFANMFAGHMLIATLFVFIWIFKNYLAAVGSVLVAIPASLLEILVAVLQAYIFTFLTTVFMGFAVRPEH